MPCVQVANWDHSRRVFGSDQSAASKEKEVIPQINEAQLHTLTEMVSGTNAFSQLVPDPSKDPPSDLALWEKGEAETQ